MKKVIYTFLAFIVVSSISFAQMKLQLPTEITGEKSNSFLNNDLESNLQLELPQNVTAPGSEFLKMWFVGMMADATFPMGDFGDGWSTGFSGHAMIGYMVARSILLTLSAGYVTFGEKESVQNIERCFSWIPLTLGANYIFNPGKRFMPFIGFALGLYFISQSFKYTFGTQTSENTDSETKFGILPRLGAYYLVSTAVLLTLVLQYNMIFTEGSSTTALGVMLGAMFAFH